MAKNRRSQETSRRKKPASKPPELAIWLMMIQRCLNPRYADTKTFGVPICERWLGDDGFANFLADLGPQPFKGAGLCRHDPTIGFEPGNVEWGPTRGTILKFEGRSMSQAEWARQLGIKESTLRARNRKGWALERMMSSRVRNRGGYRMGRRLRGRGDNNETSIR
jgi:hypothetical protein